MPERISEHGGGLLHVVAFRWIDAAPANTSAVLQDALERMAAELPSVVSYRCGADLEVFEQSWDFAVVAAVRSESDLHAYLGDPRHHHVTDTLVTPVLAQRVAVQIALREGDPLLNDAHGLAEHA